MKRILIGIAALLMAGCANMLTVNNGTGSGSYKTATIVNIKANAPQEGYVFKAWSNDTTYVVDKTVPETTVIMPPLNITVSATYVSTNLMFSLTVENGAGSGNYKAGTKVDIKANTPPSGYIFNGWSGDVSYVQSPSSPETTALIPLKNIIISATYLNTNVVPPTTPIKLGAWGGRPSCVLDKLGQLHVVVDGNMSPKMVVFDLDTKYNVKTSIIDAATWNTQTKQLFNPSQVILSDDTQLVTAWWFAANVEPGCIPRVLYRSNVSTTPGEWKNVIVSPSGFPWDPAKICPLGAAQATDFGMMNSYYELAMVNGTLTLGIHGQYGSGGGGGGEKEARIILPDGTKHVANSGSSKTKGGYYRNMVSCTTAAMWAIYTKYPKMGNDDIGHCAVAGDLKNNKIGYMCASWDYGVVFNVWDGTKMLYPVDNLPVIDPNGWSGLYKYPLAMASCPTGGAYILWTNGNTLHLALISTAGLVWSKQVCAGQIGTLCVGANGIIHIVYNNAGSIWYKQVAP